MFLVAWKLNEARQATRVLAREEGYDEVVDIHGVPEDGLDLVDDFSSDDPALLGEHLDHDVAAVRCQLAP